MPKPLNRNDYPAVKRIKYEHQTRHQLVDFGKIIGQVGPSFFHPKVSETRLDDGQFKHQSLCDADLAQLSAPGSAGR